MRCAGIRRHIDGKSKSLSKASASVDTMAPILVRVCSILAVVLLLYNMRTFPALLASASTRRVLIPQRSLAQQPTAADEQALSALTDAAFPEDEVSAGPFGGLLPESTRDMRSTIRTHDTTADPPPVTDTPAINLPASSAAVDVAGVAPTDSAPLAPVTRRTKSPTASSCSPPESTRGVRTSPRPLNWIVPPRGTWPPADCQPHGLCVALASIAAEHVVLVLADSSDSARLEVFLSHASKAGVANRVLVAALDADAAAAATAANSGAVWRPLPADRGSGSRTAMKHRLAAAVVGTGTSVLAAELGVVLKTDPFVHMGGDADVEVSGSDGGSMRVAMDFVMGWSQMCETYQIGSLHPAAIFAAGTPESRELLLRMAARLSQSDSPRTLEPYALTEELVAPAHDGVTRAGASLRILERRCFGEGGQVLELPPKESSSATLDQARILDTRDFRAKAQVLTEEACSAVSKVAGPDVTTPWVVPSQMPKARPLNWVVSPTSQEWPPPSVCAAHGLDGLCESLVRRVGSEEWDPSQVASTLGSELTGLYPGSEPSGLYPGIRADWPLPGIRAKWPLPWDPS